MPRFILSSATAVSAVLFVSALFAKQVLAADTVFPKPDPARAFSALKVYDRTGSPIRVPREDWDGARQRVKEGEWAEWLTKERVITDEWIEKRRDHVEWQAGWYHDYVSPKDGSTLIWTPDEPTQIWRAGSGPRPPVSPCITMTPSSGRPLSTTGTGSRT